MIDENKLIEDIEKLPLIHDRYDSKNVNENFINGVETMYEMIMNKIKEQYKVSGWIPCSDDNLPKEDVLCCDSYGEIMIGHVFKTDEETYDAESEHEYMYDCVAWQPLPEPYKEN